MDKAAVFGTADGGSIPSEGNYNKSYFGSLAQLAEQGPLKPKVPGSTPGRPIFKSMKKSLVQLLFFVLVSTSLVVLPNLSAKAADQSGASISVFVRENCARCQEEEKFLDKLAKENPTVTVFYYDLADPAKSDLFNKLTQNYGLAKGTPVTLVRDKLFQGYDNEKTTGKLINDIVTTAAGPNLTFEEIASGDNRVEVLSSIAQFCSEELGEICATDSPLNLTIPFTDIKIDIGELSLFSLAAVLGLVDGFNPCALWVLIMFLVILSQAESRRRMLEYAGLFIVAEAVMYYLILNVWFTAWDFVELNRIVTPLIGILALGSGVYFLYKFWTYQPVCDIVSPEERNKLINRARELAAKPLTVVVALGIMGLAFSVNVFEFACSIGIPQTFTKVLELNEIDWLGRQGYMLLYIIMYMLDDFLVFGLALFSIDKIDIAHRYSKWSLLIGGIIMLALGLALFLRPSLLVFA